MAITAIDAMISVRKNRAQRVRRGRENPDPYVARLTGRVSCRLAPPAGETPTWTRPL
jgi:hypothetical protein